MHVHNLGETSPSDCTEMLRGDYRPEPRRSGGLRPAQCQAISSLLLISYIIAATARKARNLEYSDRAGAGAQDIQTSDWAEKGKVGGNSYCGLRLCFHPPPLPNCGSWKQVHLDVACVSYLLWGQGRVQLGCGGVGTTSSTTQSRHGPVPSSWLQG